MNFDVVGNGEAFLGYLIVFPRFFFSDVPKHQLILSVRSIKHRRMSREERHGRLWVFFSSVILSAHDLLPKVVKMERRERMVQVPNPTIMAQYA